MWERKAILLTIVLIAMLPSRVFLEASDSNEYEMLIRMYGRPEANGVPPRPKNDKLGEPNDFITELIPQSEEYVVGKPMKFNLVLKNVSDSTKSYRAEGITFKPLIIRTPDNNRPYDKIGPFQPADVPTRSIDANESVTLLENQDITDDYVIIKPGKYTIQFRGGGNLPASNIVEFEVKPGTPDERDLLIDSMVGAFPDPNWRAVAPKRLRHAPAGRKEAVFSIFIVRGFLERDNIRVILWQTRLPAEVIENTENTEVSEYLGKNASGYFYIEIHSRALGYWPEMKKDITKALKLDSH